MRHVKLTGGDQQLHLWTKYCSKRDMGLSVGLVPEFSDTRPEDALEAFLVGDIHLKNLTQVLFLRFNDCNLIQRGGQIMHRCRIGDQAFFGRWRAFSVVLQYVLLYPERLC